jgi:hypothetical protein
MSYDPITINLFEKNSLVLTVDGQLSPDLTSLHIGNTTAATMARFNTYFDVTYQSELTPAAAMIIDKQLQEALVNANIDVKVSGSIGVWITGKRWRVCVVIKW